VMWNLASFQLEIVLVLEPDRWMVSARRTIGSVIVWTHLMVPLGDEGQVEAHFGPFEHNANLDTR
jgi:hypothetical protein